MILIIGWVTVCFIGACALVAAGWYHNEARIWRDRAIALEAEEIDKWSSIMRGDTVPKMEPVLATVTAAPGGGKHHAD